MAHFDSTEQGQRRGRKSAFRRTLGAAGALVVLIALGASHFSQDDQRSSEPAATRAPSEEPRPIASSSKPAASPSAEAPADSVPEAPTAGKTADERLAAMAEGDPVGTAVPMLAGVAPERQLEMLKAMMTWPDHKFLFQVPKLASARDLPLDRRVAEAEKLGHELIGFLEAQGYEYELPPGFRPTGEPVALAKVEPAH